MTTIALLSLFASVLFLVATFGPQAAALAIPAVVLTVLSGVVAVIKAQ